MKTAVVLFNLGGPDSLAAVKPFLFNLFNDPAIIGAPGPVRYLLAKLISGRRERKAQGIYAQMGGRSPILPQTQAQAAALEAALNGAAADVQWRCFVAMRYWNPRAAEALADVMQWGPDRVVLLPLYPQFSTTTSASSLREWLELADAAGLRAPTTALCSASSKSARSIWSFSCTWRSSWGALMGQPLRCAWAPGFSSRTACAGGGCGPVTRRSWGPSKACS